MKIERHRIVLQTALTFMTAGKWGVQFKIEETDVYKTTLLQLVLEANTRVNALCTSSNLQLSVI